MNKRPVICDSCGGDAELCRCSTYVALEGKDNLIKSLRKRIEFAEVILRLALSVEGKYGFDDEDESPNHWSVMAGEWLEKTATEGGK